MKTANQIAKPGLEKYLKNYFKKLKLVEFGSNVIPFEFTGEELDIKKSYSTNEEIVEGNVSVRETYSFKIYGFSLGMVAVQIPDNENTCLSIMCNAAPDIGKRGLPSHVIVFQERYTLSDLNSVVTAKIYLWPKSLKSEMSIM